MRVSNYTRFMSYFAPLHAEITLNGQCYCVYKCYFNTSFLYILNSAPGPNIKLGLPVLVTVQINKSIKLGLTSCIHADLSVLGDEVSD